MIWPFSILLRRSEGTTGGYSAGVPVALPEVAVAHMAASAVKCVWRIPASEESDGTNNLSHAESFFVVGDSALSPALRTFHANRTGGLA